MDYFFENTIISFNKVIKILLGFTTFLKRYKAEIQQSLDLSFSWGFTRKVSLRNKIQWGSEILLPDTPEQTGGCPDFKLLNHFNAWHYGLAYD